MKRLTTVLIMRMVESVVSMTIPGEYSSAISAGPNMYKIGHIGTRMESINGMKVYVPDANKPLVIRILNGMRNTMFSIGHFRMYVLSGFTVYLAILFVIGPILRIIDDDSHLTAFVTAKNVPNPDASRLYTCMNIRHVYWQTHARHVSGKHITNLTSFLHFQKLLPMLPAQLQADATNDIYNDVVFNMLLTSRIFLISSGRMKA